ncbi:MAG: sugar phosphate isomerase/epimerase [Gemmatimonadetes bacterium]|nr:sugar phosphate isomerase/epimerase [Gemmatimonadota bacterium]
MVSRREVLRRMGGLAAGAAVMGCSGETDSGGAISAEASMTAASSGPGTTPLAPLGVQLYTLRSEMEGRVEQTLERVAAIGYQEVEFVRSQYFGHSPTEIREMLARTGLRSPASHITPSFETDAWARILDDANEVGHEYVVVASIPLEMRASLDDWRRTAELMTSAGERARAAGLRYAYHNHDFEFVEMDGRVAFDVFCEESDPELVQIELELFWIIHGGGDPVAFFDRWPGRVPLVHVKDRTAAGEMVDVGAGVIDWPGLFRHIDHAGMKHFLVEHDRPDGPFRSIEASYRYLSALEV